jgi:hypothetical protein
MKFLFDINHPAHVHFFRHPLCILKEHGHSIIVTSRAKEMAVPLLDELGIEHVILSAQKGGGLLSLGRELVQRDAALYRVARRYRPDAMAAIGGTFIAHVGFLTRTPSLVFYDTENAKLQNAITYPFATRVIVPRCYQAWVPVSHLRYDGYHELSYLHPTRFIPSKEIAVQNGLDPQRDNFLIRTVSWQANHDVGETGWTEKLLTDLVAFLSLRGKVHISSEAPLPPQLATHAYHGKVSEVHHLMALCRLFIGESATMASECAVLGVPAIYAAKTGRGYTDEEESRYGLVTNIRKLEWDFLRAAIDQMLGKPHEYWRQRRTQLLADTIDVAAYVADTIEQAGRGV